MEIKSKLNIGDEVYYFGYSYKEDFFDYKIKRPPFNDEYYILKHEKIQGFIVEDDSILIPSCNSWDGWYPIDNKEIDKENHREDYEYFTSEKEARDYIEKYINGEKNIDTTITWEDVF